VKPRLFATYLVIVLAPLGLLAWLGAGLARDEQAQVESRYRELMSNQLAVRKEAVAAVVDRTERELEPLLELPLAVIPMKAQVKGGSQTESVVEASVIREKIRGSRLARQIFVLQPDRGFLFPLLDGKATEKEKAFFERTRSVWESGIRLGQEQDFAGQQIAPPTDSWIGKPGREAIQTSRWAAASISNASPYNAQTGWHSWFWGNGVHLIHWRRHDSGHVVGVEVDRMALLADVVSGLPDTEFEPSASLNGRIALRNAQNQAIYQWGSYEPPENAEPDVRMAIDAPLAMWTLNYYPTPGTLSSGAAWFNVGTALALSSLVIAALAVYFFRENAREIREAAQRVSFVNQVSHELKTPLTNIRMYAEMLEPRMEEADESARDNLRVIVSESQRLSRMIGNVLAFAKNQRGALRPNPRHCVPDDVIRATIDHFRPALDAKGVSVSFAAGAPEEALLDSDFLEQILGNLLGNVEKYAAVKGELQVVSRASDNELTVQVVDRGPGIPADQRERVFQPFQRLSDKLTEGVAGTGIGLAIAREQARTHGGDLIIVDSDQGAAFQLTLRLETTKNAA